MPKLLMSILFMLGVSISSLANEFSGSGYNPQLSKTEKCSNYVIQRNFVGTFDILKMGAASDSSPYPFLPNEIKNEIAQYRAFIMSSNSSNLKETGVQNNAGILSVKIFAELKRVAANVACSKLGPKYEYFLRECVPLNENQNNEIHNYDIEDFISVCNERYSNSDDFKNNNPLSGTWGD